MKLGKITIVDIIIIASLIIGALWLVNERGETVKQCIDAQIEKLEEGCDPCYEYAKYKTQQQIQDQNHLKIDQNWGKNNG